MTKQNISIKISLDIYIDKRVMVGKPETVAEALERIRRFHRSVAPAELSGEQRADLQALIEVIKNHHRMQGTVPLIKAVTTSGLDKAIAEYYYKWIARWNDQGEL